MNVRTALKTDEAAVVALWRECDLVVDYNDPSADFQFALQGPSSTVLVSEDETGNGMGTVMVGHDGHRGWLYYVAVTPQIQHTGMGRRLVQAAEQWLKEQGIVKAQLLIRETNTKVIRFYERLGFEVAPRTVMGKWLD
jgi:ribosomal protein S18 acetylase RimI-like enzyme